MQESKDLSLKEIELYYDTQSIHFEGDYVWPIIRFKINEELRKKRGLSSRTVKINKGVLLTLSKTFLYGIKETLRLRRYSFWVFSSSERRKKIHGKYVDRVMEPILNQYPKTLAIENPYPLGRHYPKKELRNKNVLSQTAFFLGIKLTGLFMKRKLEVENESELNLILKENGITLDYFEVLRNHSAQYHFMKQLLRFVKPKAVFFIYSASSMGFIKALKEKKIPVIELQHGVINESHYAYNVFKDFGDTFFPDYLLTYGQMELEIFGRRNYFIDRECVFPVGYYFVEEMINAPWKDTPLGTLKEKFDKIIVFSLQDPFEEYIFEFLKKTAALNEKVCYLLVPRIATKLYPAIQNVRNLIVSREMNIYECLKIADFHATINSTCAIESLCFGVPNILFNYNNWAFNYYGGILNDTGHTVFVETPQEFINIMEGHNFHTKAEIEKKSSVFIKRDYTQNIKEVLDKIILEKADE